jgi:hypothetical protein
MSFLYQIEEKQEKLKQVYSQQLAQRPIKPKVVLIEVKAISTPVAIEPVKKVKPPVLERMIAVSLPAELHTQAEDLMKALEFKGSKREFVRDVLQAAFTVLIPDPKN